MSTSSLVSCCLGCGNWVRLLQVVVGCVLLGTVATGCGGLCAVGYGCVLLGTIATGCGGLRAVACCWVRLLQVATGCDS
jgi:hypothetical protein